MFFLLCTPLITFSPSFPYVEFYSYHRAHLDKRQAKLDLKAVANTNVDLGGTDSAGPTRHPTEEMGVAGPSPTAGSDGQGGKEGKEGKELKAKGPPAKKYWLLESMKAIVRSCGSGWC